jgi:hypothetical protein
MADYESLLEYCNSDSQTTTVQACIDEGTTNKAAKKLDKSPGTVCNTLDRIRKNASRRGWSPEHDMTKTTAPGFAIKGTSTLYDEDGKVKIQWVKTNAEVESNLEIAKQVVDIFKSDLPVYKSKPITTTGVTNPELLNNFVISDFHLGMMSWGEETGDDWDMQIAEELLIKWFNSAIESSPNAETALLTQLGDFLHWDGMEGVTPSSGHILDVDSRFQKLVRVAIRLLRSVIDKLLATHGKVHCIMATGNHDMASSVWLREMLAHVYDNEPRLTIDLSPDIYYCYEHGLTSLFVHHGHKKRINTLSDVMAAKFREVFGRTKYSYAHTGHLHHAELKETNLMVVEQHRTLAGKDAYASQGGYISGRDAQVITYSKSFGEVSRIKISPEMVM